MCWLHASRSTAVIINADLIMKKNNAHKCIISVKNMPWAAYNFIPIVMYVCVCMEYYKKKFYRKKEGSKWWWKNHCLLKPIWIIMAHGYWWNVCVCTAFSLCLALFRRGGVITVITNLKFKWFLSQRDLARQEWKLRSPNWRSVAA